MSENIYTETDIFTGIIDREGGYVNHPDDKGGPTCWGITEKTARAHGYHGDMQSLTKEQAMEIYRADYWHGPRFDEISLISNPVAIELCDTGVNMGPSVPSKWLQEWLNVMNQKGSLYPDLTPDGHIGPRTVNALKQYLSIRGSEGESVLLRALNCSQGARYLELAEKREANETFIYGWMKERVG